VLLWYAGLVLAGFLMHLAMLNTASMVLASGFAAAAAVIPLSLLGYTMRRYGDTFNSQILVPAIGPIVIAVLIFEYVEYTRRVDDAYSAQLIPANLVLLSDVKWTRGASSRTGRLSGHVVNRSPHQLTGMTLEVALYRGGEKLDDELSEARLNVAPGQQGNFNTVTPQPPAKGANELDCAPENPPPRGNRPGALQCLYRIAATRGEEVFF
jgi:hypothetical protein